MYNFDKIEGRIGTANVKWDAREVVFGTADVLPMSIADMDFPVAQEIVEALTKRAAHPIYGYGVEPPSLWVAMSAWMEKRHHFQVCPEDIIVLPGVVAGIAFSLQAFTKPGEGVIVQTPVYPPFMETITYTGRRIIENRLQEENGYYTIDLDDLEAKAKDPKTTALLLCSPHNPVGRVWTKEELMSIEDICHRHGVQIIADEIHHDIVYPGHRHTVLATIHERVAQEVVTLVSVSKTFNLAGLSIAFAIVKDAEKRSALQQELARYHLLRANVFGAPAAEAAYRHGEVWLEELLTYLEENAQYVTDFINNEMVDVKVRKPEGTYLAWLDFRAYFSDNNTLRDFLIEEAKLGLNLGAPYGTPGLGFARLNFAAPRSILAKGLKSLAVAMEGIHTTSHR